MTELPPEPGTVLDLELGLPGDPEELPDGDADRDEEFDDEDSGDDDYSEENYGEVDYGDEEG